jgi:hypothetical protein
MPQTTMYNRMPRWEYWKFPDPANPPPLEEPDGGEDGGDAPGQQPGQGGNRFGDNIIVSGGRGPLVPKNDVELF